MSQAEQETLDMLREEADLLMVRQRYAETDSFVHRDDITAHLLAHPEARAFLQQAYAQTEQKRSFEWYVGN